MSTLDVSDFVIDDDEDMWTAFKTLRAQGWICKLSAMSRTPGGDIELYLTVEKATQSATLFLGDQLKSIGGGILMTLAEYEALFG